MQLSAEGFRGFLAIPNNDLREDQHLMFRRTFQAKRKRKDKSKVKEKNKKKIAYREECLVTWQLNASFPAQRF